MTEVAVCAGIPLGQDSNKSDAKNYDVPAKVGE